MKTKHRKIKAEPFFTYTLPSPAEIAEFRQQLIDEGKPVPDDLFEQIRSNCEKAAWDKFVADPKGDGRTIGALLSSRKKVLDTNQTDGGN